MSDVRPVELPLITERRGSSHKRPERGIAPDKARVAYRLPGDEWAAIADKGERMGATGGDFYDVAHRSRQVGLPVIVTPPNPDGSISAQRHAIVIARRHGNPARESDRNVRLAGGVRSPGKHAAIGA